MIVKGPLLSTFLNCVKVLGSELVNRLWLRNQWWLATAEQADRIHAPLRVLVDMP